ncbi:glycosyltransferase family 9 protein [Sphingobacterium sp. HJSM2_6]|uniref:glycosyltransferase family 9 protein n=1 Tax=Sphingobacterium sp. HJSM2_6 TaxID=3366264 RepID=UPI003BECB7EB
MKRIIVTRFSAMGDVAMVASVLKTLQNQQEDLEIILVSRPFFKSFFDQIPRLRFHAIEPKGRHQGIFGLFSLFKELKKYQPDAVADLHNNLRSRFLDVLFKLAGIKTQVLDKGRAAKNALTRQENKILKPLKATTERYADVFRSLGIPVKLDHQLHKEFRLISQGMQQIVANQRLKIGISPFAQHSYKIFPLHKMEEVLQFLSLQQVEVILFGGGDKEKQICEQWAASFPNVTSVVGQYSLKEELDIISHLDVMISMDSAGMHMASLVGTRSISLWGATHPYAGFLGYGQQIEDCIQVDHPNRPNSVYGNKPCPCGDIEAIDLISSAMVIDKLKLVISENK